MNLLSILIKRLSSVISKIINPRLCIKYPEVGEMLFEEENCLTNCQRKIKEVQHVVKELMNELSIKNNSSEYLI
jgi:hypothetical protein